MQQRFCLVFFFLSLVVLSAYAPKPTPAPTTTTPASTTTQAATTAPPPPPPPTCSADNQCPHRYQEIADNCGALNPNDCKVQCFLTEETGYDPATGDCKMCSAFEGCDPATYCSCERCNANMGFGSSMYEQYYTLCSSPECYLGEPPCAPARTTA